MQSNFEVNADVDDDAVWARLIIYHFPNSHQDTEDLGLKTRFQTDKAKQGILKWAVDGAVEWYKLGRLYVPECVKKNIQEHKDLLDTVAMWVEDCVNVEEGVHTSSVEIRGSYERWCEGNGVEPKRAKYFTQSLSKRIPTAKQAKKQDVRGYYGLKIRGSQPDLRPF